MSRVGPDWAVGEAATRVGLARAVSPQMTTRFRPLRLLSPTTRSYGTRRRIMTNNLRYLLVLDFEATCGESGFPREQMEIIEFPTILYDLQMKREVDRFHEYVKPVIRPQLTEFCTQLTGITQVSTSDPHAHYCSKPLIWLPRTGDGGQRRTLPARLGSLQRVSKETKAMGGPFDIRLHYLRSMGLAHNAAPTTLPGHVKKPVGRIRRPPARYPLPRSGDQHQNGVPKGIRVQARKGDGEDARSVEDESGGKAPFWNRRLWKHLEDCGKDGGGRMGSGSRTGRLEIR